MTTGERIKHSRKRLNLSAEKLASIIKVSPATIYRWEKGDIEKVPAAILEPLADALQTTPNYLLGIGEKELATVSPETLALIAEHFGITVDELLGRLTEKEALAMQGLQLDEKHLITEYRRLSDEGKTMLFQYCLFLRSQYPKESAAPSAP